MKTQAFQAGRRAATIGATSILVAATTLLAAPAQADSDDIDVTKSANVAIAAPGDTVSYTVVIDHVGGLLSSDRNVTLSDSLPPYTSYVPGTSTATLFDAWGHVAADGFNFSSFSNGLGWAGPWVETNDDGTAAGGGIRVQSTVLRLRDGYGLGQPSIAREVALPGTAVNVDIAFGVLPISVEADDSFGVELSYDGGATWNLIESWDGTNVPLAVALNVPGVEASSLMIRFVVLSGTDVTDPICFPYIGCVGSVAESFSISALAISVDTRQTWTDIGDPTSGGLAEGPWDLGFRDSLTITYDAVIDSVIPDATTELTNTAIVTSDDDPTGEIAEATIALTRTPDLDIDIAQPGSSTVGATLDLTATVTHSATSDGAPVCDFELHIDGAAPTAFTYASGDTNSDGCVDYDETWILTKTLTGATGTSGLQVIALRGTGIEPDTDAYERVGSITFTVVLAESGPEDKSGLLVSALGLALLGAGLVVSTRRRPE